MIEDQNRRKLKADELDDVIGSKPMPMNEETVISHLQGHKFKFSIPNYEDYLKESRKLCEAIICVSEFNLDTAIDKVHTHFQEATEPQYKSIFVMRLL